MRIEEQWPQLADTCTRCGRLLTINGRAETVMIQKEPDGTYSAHHFVCDERWDNPSS